MLEAIVSSGPKVKIVNSPIPKPGPNQVLVKVAVTAANPKDWKVPEWTGKEGNTGDDGAGIVEAVGDKVSEFSKGDRVAGFHEMGGPGGTYGEYALFPEHLTIHIAKDISFEEASTIPLTAATAACGLFESDGGLGLPFPSSPTSETIPLVLYGASGSVGAFAVQLAKKSNIHPLICVAGGGAKTIQHLLDSSKGDAIVDYRKGDEAVTQGIKSALAGKTLKHALDTTAHGSTSTNIAKAMTEGGTIARTLGPEGELPHGVKQFQLSVSTVHSPQQEFGAKMFKLFGQGLQQGWLEPRPYEVVRGGLNGVEKALADLKAGKASAVKYVLRIDETDGLDGTA
ncbi:hypothetical protein B0A54_14090 [Friedmanniomyces endolithicus]|uniref:Enoyl reductase (ER) domain-containing protein n=1 Tax=Friedmanniomyces endolithicus TaxID=329885 RepID=A0A4U0UD69_9PEZI|nr:hypothetical protein LTS09_012636 [Friedmanniomyces endolithicus]TKA33393.1 hypothetical protein B0A54_14090 [Friedmanniomyces endolithicus]